VAIDAIFYDLPDGTEPANEFIRELDKKMQAKMLWTIALLESSGTNIREPYSKHLADGIFELRAKVATDISRVLFFFVIGNRAILTHGFVKKDEKTPRAEIVRAKKYRNEYLNREEGQI
jgi:phage-related protein